MMTTMYDTILVPLDRSPLAESALPYAELIPSRRVALLEVDPDDRGPMLASAPELERWRNERNQRSRAYLETAGSEFRRQGRQLCTNLLFGDPADQIVTASRAADLIIMSTHGRGAGGRFVAGSVADAVARRAATATLLVRGGAIPVPGPPVSRLVVPLDGSPRAERALPIAIQLASLLGGALHLVRVVEPRSGISLIRLVRPKSWSGTGGPKRGLNTAARYLEDQKTALRNHEGVVTSALLTGSVTERLTETLLPGDIIVVSTHGRGGVRRWLLGSVAVHLVHKSPAPVLLVRAATRPN